MWSPARIKEAILALATISWASVTGKPAVASTAEMTTGTETGVRLMSPKLVDDAIDAHTHRSGALTLPSTTPAIPIPAALGTGNVDVTLSEAVIDDNASVTFRTVSAGTTAANPMLVSFPSTRTGVPLTVFNRTSGWIRFITSLRSGRGRGHNNPNVTVLLAPRSATRETAGREALFGAGILIATDPQRLAGQPLLNDLRKTIGPATETREGLVEEATAAEMTAGTADKFPDAAKVKAYVDGASGGVDERRRRHRPARRLGTCGRIQRRGSCRFGFQGRRPLLRAGTLQKTSRALSCAVRQQNIAVHGVTTDGTTIWVVDQTNDTLWAFNKTTRARDSAKDFSTTLLRSAASNVHINGVTTDGTTIWVADETNDTLWAFNKTTRARDSAKDFSATILRSAESRISPTGVTTDGTTIWVADWYNGVLWAFNKTTHARDSAKDFSGTLLRSAATNIAVHGVTTDGTTIWVVDQTNDTLWAFNKTTRARDSAKDFSGTLLRSAASSIVPTGVATDGTTIWVCGPAERRSVGLQHCIDTRLPRVEGPGLR